MYKLRLPLGLRPTPPLGSYSAPSDPLVVFKGSTSKGREGREGGKAKGN